MSTSQTACTSTAEMSCPTCNARQKWSSQCRRCKCDLSMLFDVWKTSRLARSRCLAHLRAGRLVPALRAARRYRSLCPGSESIRLLAVTQLVSGSWAEALVTARGGGE
jgi:hypothetical protein